MPTITKTVVMTETEYREHTSNMWGYCLTCDQSGGRVEPDAWNYACEECDSNTLCSVEELLVAGRLEFSELEPSTLDAYSSHACCPEEFTPGPKLRFTKGTCGMSIREAGSTEIQTIPALVHKGLAIHRSHEPTRWSVTHVGSALGVTTIAPTQKAARILAEALIALGIDWTRPEAELRGHVSKQVLPVLKMWKRKYAPRGY